MKKKIGVLIAVVFIVIGVGLGVWKYVDYRKEQNRLAQDPYFTEYHLSSTEFGIMKRYLYFDILPDDLDWNTYGWDIDKANWPDYSFYTMKFTDDTKKSIVILNYYLFDRCADIDNESVELASLYGFDKDTQITAEWAETHPKEIIAIIQKLGNRGDTLIGKENMNSLYEEITRKK